MNKGQVFNNNNLERSNNGDPVPLNTDPIALTIKYYKSIAKMATEDLMKFLSMIQPSQAISVMKLTNWVQISRLSDAFCKARNHQQGYSMCSWEQSQMSPIIPHDQPMVSLLPYL